MRLLAPALAGFGLLFVVSPALADPPGVEATPEAPPAIAVRVVEPPWAPPPKVKPARTPVSRAHLKLGLLIGAAGAAVTGGALLAGGVELTAHPPVERSCFVVTPFGCPRQPSYVEGAALLFAGGLTTAAGITLASVALGLRTKPVADEAPPRAALTVGPGSARLAFAF